MRTALVNLKGVELCVEYEYDPPESSADDHPGFPGEAHLYSAKLKGIELIEMLEGVQVERIEQILEEGQELTNKQLELA